MNQKKFAAHLASRDLPEYARQFDSPLDRWISFAVKVLKEGGIETFESCEGTKGHTFLRPTIRFYGGPGEGFRAYAVAVTFGLPVRSLHRSWSVQDGELTGPDWEIVFFPIEKLKRRQLDAEKSGLIT